MAIDKKVFAISKKDDQSIATGFKTAYSNGDGTYTVEFINGTKVITAPIKGDKGDKGDKFEFSDFTPEEIESLKVKGDKGEQGDKGVGILSITKQGTAGLVDTYLILFDDGTTATYDVVNGANITKLSELENDENFIKATTMALINYYMRDEVYSKVQIDELLRNLGAGISLDIVDVLPTENISPTTIYLLSTGGSNFNQYIYVNNEWRGIGSTSVDMTNYYNKAQIDNKLEDYCTLVRLTNKLDDYMLKANVSKVGKSNDYNDLDNLPEIPDVSGIKPYSETLQNSNETAPTSKVVYDAVQEINTALEDKADETDLDDYALAETVGDLADLKTTEKGSVVGAVNEVNVNLGVLSDALEDKADKAELNAIPLLYNQNTDILAYALTCPIKKRTLVRIHSANAINNPFGVASDTDFIYEIDKIDSANSWVGIKAKDVRTNQEFVNTNNDGIWLGWKRIANGYGVQSKVISVTQGSDYNITQLVGAPIDDVISMIGFGNTNTYDFCIINGNTETFTIRVLKGSGDVRINYVLA